jgi:hypothetical protein
MSSPRVQALEAKLEGLRTALLGSTNALTDDFKRARASEPAAGRGAADELRGLLAELRAARPAAGGPSMPGALLQVSLSLMQGAWGVLSRPDVHATAVGMQSRHTAGMLHIDELCCQELSCAVGSCIAHQVVAFH